MSTPHTASDDPGTGFGAGVAQPRLLGVTPEEFAENYWGRKALLSRQVADFSDLFSAAAVDELLSRRGLRTPFLRMAKDGATLADRSFTAPAGVGATIGDQLDDTAIWRQFADGATIVLQALQRTWAPIGEFTSQLATELGHPVQANAYITPRQNRGFDDHYDVHDVFVLQIAGSKRWVIHEPVHPDPLRDQPWTDHRAAVAEAAQGEPVIDTMLQPGDCLYLPRGWLHAAQAQDEVSIHVTLGVHAWTRYAIAEELVQDALTRLRDDPEARQSLPIGVNDPADVVDTVRKQLLAVLGESDPAPAFHRARNRQSRPGPLGPLAQQAAVDTLDESSMVRLRESLAPRLDAPRLHTRVGWLDFEADELPAIQQLLDGQPRAAGDIGLALTARLLRAGVAVPATP
ncbi:MAG TPA: cupin domain-containing protein [Flexivirga sp.]|uniref:cupin domain-containing protein n=1 Tax=Flexivirga sp. TaxID=1962927 RepID=UPI002B5EE78B|nr:cupin domain-containing protein [Flexivirga sp.]HWC23532.1 cupin domain-containing protein [Flexivirga sp.]